MENKKKDFSEWYNEIIDVSQLSDKRYPIKGMNVWLPYGWRAMKNIDNVVRENVDSMEFQEVNFPVLITRDMLTVEFEHIKGFENELYWVTRGGKEQLDIELALRPTSEAAMYPMFSLWVRTHADLPLKIYQIVSVYRYETKHTRSFIRIREIHFFESHTAHRNHEEAEQQMSEYMDIWKKISSMLCLPFHVDRRPEWDKFPGAVYSLAFDTALPSGRSLQIGTIHQYDDNFAKNYDIKYSDENGQPVYAFQTTFGLSERLLAAVIGIHGDDTGLVFPPDIAPFQVVVIPIPSENPSQKSFIDSVCSILKKHGIRVKLDDRDAYTPGYKFNDWEMRGVPLRIEIGTREVSDAFVTVAKRTSKGRQKIQLNQLPDGINMLLERVKEEITERAIKQFHDLSRRDSTIEEMKSYEGISLSGWCGSRECSDTIEKETEKVVLGINVSTPGEAKCVVCGKPGKIASFSRTY
ncbi:Proline--tRNA ligase [Thermoplasmatales archaeon]|nr:Proline--tRNA ligase [Thermoplasmatales archaeon]